MRSTKNIPIHERMMLLDAICTKMDCSWDILDATATLIKNTGLKSGSKVAEAKAKELRGLIETGISEAELLKRIAEM